MGVRWRVNCSCIIGAVVVANQVSAAPMSNLQRKGSASCGEEAPSSIFKSLDSDTIDAAIAHLRAKKGGVRRDEKKKERG